MLPSQSRIITYTDQGLQAAILMLENRGVPEDTIALQLEPAIDAYADLNDHVLNGPQRCWEWSVPGNVSGQWLAGGGPLTPWENGPTLYSLMLQDSIVLGWLGRNQPLNCRAYFAQLAQLEERLGSALRAVQVPGWPGVLEAAADEGRSRVADLSGPTIIPWWLWAAAAYLAAREWKVIRA
jgi:hypothetical protein